MKSSFLQKLRRGAAAALSAAMLWGALVPAATVWAGEETADPAPLAVQLYSTINQPQGEPLQDGDSIAGWNYYNNPFFLLCRGDAESPVLKEEASLEIISHATGEALPGGVLVSEFWEGDYALYHLFTPSSETASSYFGSVSPDFAFDLVFSSGGESVTIHVLNENVEVSMDSSDVMVSCLGVGNYCADLGSLWVTSQDLSGYTPTLDWIAQDIGLSGDLAQYFSVSWVNGSKVMLNAVDLSQLQDGQMITGQITWTGKLDGQPHSRPAYYRHSANLQGAWYERDESTGSWVPYSYRTLRAGDKGSFQLQVYGSGGPNYGSCFSLADAVINTDLPAGIQATLQPDNCTLLVEYDLTGADFREQPYSIQVQVPGVNLSWVQIQVNQAPQYALAIDAGDVYSYTDGNSWPKRMRSLMEDYVVVPLVDGRPAATQEELEQCALSVQDSEDSDILRIVPRQVTYLDEKRETHSAWALAIVPLYEESFYFDGTSHGSPAREMVIQREGETLGTVRYDVQGCDSYSDSRDILLKADYLYTYNASQASPHSGRFLLLDENGQSLPLTQAPIITGEAAQNITVTWAEGLSGVRVDFTDQQIPGQAVVELRSGNTVRKLVYDCKAFVPSATYYSLGTDYMRRPYTETLNFTEELSNLAMGIASNVATTRFVEDGSFDLYLYSTQYISHKNLATVEEMGSRLSFGTELVKSVTYTSSDPDILKVEQEIRHTDEKDPVFDGNGYSNPDGNCYGIRLTPGGKTGSCDVYATIELNIPSKNDPFGCDTSRTPEVVCIGYTFNVQSSETVQTVYAGPDDLLQVLADIELTPTPVVVLLEGGEYPMDLNLAGKNIILRSQDAENPAVFTGTPGQEGGFIITVDSPSPDFALEDLVIDGGGVRGGVLQIPYAGQPQNAFTIRRCRLQNCTTGVKGSDPRICLVRQTTFENCQVGAQGGTLYSCLLQNNDAAILADTNARWTRFVDNQVDVRILSTSLGAAEYTLSLPQNYWNGASGPSVEVVDQESGKPLTGKTVHRYTSPYYTDSALSVLNVDLDTTQTQGDTLLLPLEMGGEDAGSLLLAADAFANIQQSGKESRFPITDENGDQLAQWNFASIQYTDIDTDLEVSDELSDNAQQTVDQLPQEDQDKILQEVNLSHNGQLPGRATLRIKASDVPSGDLSQLRLYWVKPDGTVVPAEVVDVQFDAAQQCYIITVDHCSEYIITSGSLSVDDDGEGGGDGGEGGSQPTPSPSPAPQPTATPAPSQPDGGNGGNSGNAGGSTSGSGASSETSVQKTPVPPAQSGQSQLYSAQQVLDAFDSQTGDVTLAVDAQNKVSQKAFELLKERSGARLRLQGEGYAWIFAADSIADTTLPEGVFDAAVSLEVSAQAKERIQAFAADKPWQAIETAFSGQLPGPAQLELKLSALAGMHCGLYLLPEEGEPEHIADVDVSDTGTAVLPLEHCSVYFLVAEDADSQQTAPSPTPASSAEPVSQPETPAENNGLPLGILGAAVVAVVVIAAAVWFFRRKKQD